MAVSWYSPSAILTPGGVAAGLSDIGQVIASAPERQAQIQRQMAADARAEREAALMEMRDLRAAEQIKRDEAQRQLVNQRTAEQIQRDEAQRQFSNQLRAIDIAESTGQMLPGYSPNQAVAGAAGLFAQRERERQAREQAAHEASGLKALGMRSEMVYSGQMDPSTLPFTEAAGGMTRWMEGMGDRAQNRALLQAQIDRTRAAATGPSWQEKEAIKQQNRLALAAIANQNRQDMSDYSNDRIDSRMMAGKLMNQIADAEDRIEGMAFAMRDSHDPQDLALIEKWKQDVNKMKADLSLLQQGGGQRGPQQTTQTKSFRDSKTGAMVPHVLQNGQWVRVQ